MPVPVRKTQEDLLPVPAEGTARAHSHLLAALPPGTFPGVDDTEDYAFLERNSPETE